jgi:hypothetical protein
VEDGDKLKKRSNSIGFRSKGHYPVSRIFPARIIMIGNAYAYHQDSQQYQTLDSQVYRYTGTRINFFQGKYAGKEFSVGGSGLAESTPSEPPTETDTVHISRAVVLTDLQGQIFKKAEDGKLLPVTSGISINPGDVLLVRRGASFAVGRTKFGAESQEDRWVRFQ